MKSYLHIEKVLKSLIISFLIIYIPTTLNAQYIVNGNASKDNCNCYTLTPDAETQHGSVWNINKISLANSFDYNFTVLLGYNDPGADGIAFVLQPISTSVGSTGGGLGYQGISPSIGVTIDTYQNNGTSDPAYDHIAIQKNGDLDHASANNVAGPVQALLNSPNIEDGVFHTFRVVWDAVSHQLDAYLDGDLRVSTNIDLVSSIFGGDPMVFWGFTGSTGGAQNLQRFCTQNIAAVSNLDPQSYCDSATISFSDASLSSSGVSSWSWSFGDGTSSTEQNPTHHYAQPGNYNTKLFVIGNDGCNSDTLILPITINPNPIANFSSIDACLGVTTSFTNQSSIPSGSITSWKWDYGVTPTENSSDQNTTYTYTSSGTYSASLIATSDKGCIDTVVKTVTIHPNPVADFDVINPTGCSPFCVDFINNTSVSSGNISQWTWDFENGNSTEKNPNNCYTNTTSAASTYSVGLIAKSDKGCSDTVVKIDYITVHPQPNAQFSADPLIVDLNNTEVTFTNSSTNATSYSWNFGDGTPNSNSGNTKHEFPATGFGEYWVVLTAKNSIGCLDTASVKITVTAPDPIYEIPNVFSPNGDGKNDTFQLINPENIGATSITIFNRWGNIVHENTSLNFSWDGKTQTDDACFAGVYFYQVKITGLNGKEIEEQGYVHLIR